MNTSLSVSMCVMPVSALLASLSGNQILLCRWSCGLAFARYFFRP